jgi:hypothetical protein
MLAERFACATGVRLFRPYFLLTVRTSSRWVCLRQVDARHERFHSEDTPNDTCFHSEKHTTKACLQCRQFLNTGIWRTTDRAGKHIHSPPVDFRGVLSDRIIVDESSEDGRHVDDDVSSSAEIKN